MIALLNYPPTWTVLIALAVVAAVTLAPGKAGSQ